MHIMWASVYIGHVCAGVNRKHIVSSAVCCLVTENTRKEQQQWWRVRPGIVDNGLPSFAGTQIVTIRNQSGSSKRNVDGINVSKVKHV